MRWRLMCLALAPPLALLAGWGTVRCQGVGEAGEPEPSGQATTDSGAARADRSSTNWTTAVEPKPLSENVKKGLDWLAEHQLEGGGWGQGEEAARMRGGEARRDQPNVADTCVAALALIRSGSTPTQGPYKDAIARAVRFVREQVEASDSQSLAVTGIQGTRVQQKLGPNIDTFLASMLLAEVKGRMPDEATSKGVDLALAKVLGKIERHQKADGSFDGQGWAPILAQSMSGKGINRARQAGARVSEMALARAEDGAKLAFAETTARPAALAGSSTLGASASAGYGSFGARAGRGDAGVELYSRAASVGVLQDSVNTNEALARELRKEVETAKDEGRRDQARRRLEQIAEGKKVQRDAQKAVIERLGDKQFIAGFGSNGGEEFLSYMNIAESLVVKGGAEWTAWDASMAENLNRVQNGDGSWSGHHCITGRTFCTSTALLVLLADRTPVPVEARDDAKRKSPGE